MPKDKYVCIESPDDTVTIDFLGTGSKLKKDRRACTVTVKVEGGKLCITAKGFDDHVTILCDGVYDIPEEDRRS